ncbi:MAG: hypothetical protein CNF01_01485 [Halieaceae bacterium MED-G27]|nr:MAG: hypothetical protein CNF01_01485 [Halieaceae bacterium MED-G27]
MRSDDPFWQARRTMPTVAMLLAFMPGLSSTIGLLLSSLVLLVLVLRYLPYHQIRLETSA